MSTERGEKREVSCNYNYLAEREGANDKLREELLKYVSWCQELDMGRLPDGFQDFLEKQIEG